VIDLPGERVRLRPITLDDVDALAATGEDPEKLRRRIERNPTLEHGGFLSLGVEGDGRIVGEIQARAPQHGFPPGVCEIGISLAEEARGKGYGQEAVVLFTDYLLQAGQERVQASTSVDNVAMRRVLEAIGYAFEGVLRSFAPGEDGGREDYAMYAATRAEWRAR
jgi:N-acetyltransferase